MKASIYIADDEKNIRDVITKFLESDGYSVSAFENGDLLMQAFLKKPAQLVILDIMMPGTDGLTICKQLREITNVPIIMLSAKDTEFDYVQGITIGGDDYLTKPFRPTTLLMRVRSLLRRMDMNNPKATEDKPQSLTVGNLEFNAPANTVYCNGKAIGFSQTELKMLTYMLKNTEKAYSKEELLEKIWGFETQVETRVTDETLRRIRRKLSLAGSNVSVETIWGYGYKINVAGD
ncbi:response regulator transcription factor [Oscillospiraceae bacterium LCP25S3_E10]|nr:response regulator transcription factor [Ruminococcus sp.]MDD6446436.1 response regulator transcription factor [Ruminococcus sp.]MDY2856889.1 response regulator transcription factor [Oscillospiraceae bacterium]